MKTAYLYIAGGFGLLLAWFYLRKQTPVTNKLAPKGGGFIGGMNSSIVHNTSPNPSKSASPTANYVTAASGLLSSLLKSNSGGSSTGNSRPAVGSQPFTNSSDFDSKSSGLQETGDYWNGGQDFESGDTFGGVGGFDAGGWDSGGSDYGNDSFSSDSFSGFDSVDSSDSSGGDFFDE